uniref:Uncharacterized protein n=1 Tax=Moniliophthora roreri TaxID=221103 RepID=A0A0W0F573_MONRR
MLLSPNDTRKIATAQRPVFHCWTPGPQRSDFSPVSCCYTNNLGHDPPNNPPSGNDPYRLRDYPEARRQEYGLGVEGIGDTGVRTCEVQTYEQQHQWSSITLSGTHAPQSSLGITTTTTGISGGSRLQALRCGELAVYWSWCTCIAPTHHGSSTSLSVFVGGGGASSQQAAGTLGSAALLVVLVLLFNSVCES